MTSKKYGTKIADFILANSKGMPVSTLAERIGISQSYMSEMLNGKRDPSIEVSNKIADFFGVPRVKLYALFGWVDQSELDTQLQLYLDLIRNDPDFKEFADVYSEFTSVDDKKRAINVLKSLITYKKGA